MDMPFSNFSAFHSLSIGQWSNPSINRITEQFKLFVVVLCDLGEGEFLSKIDDVSYITSKNILFISINDTLRCGFDYNEWLCRNKQLSFGINDYISRSAPFDSIDIAYLARQFNISVTDWPALVLTNNLLGTDAVVIKTSKEEVGTQLVHLAREVEGHPTPINLLELQLLMQNSKYAIQQCRKTIADILTDVFRRIQLQFHWDDSVAVLCNNQAVEGNLKNLNYMDDATEEAMTDRENELMDYAFNRSVQVRISDNWRWQSGHWKNAERFFIAESRLKGCETDTLSSLRIYNILTQDLAKLDFENRQEDPSYDYSVLSLYLIKVFENELASSIVQQMRQALDIPMPDFYRKPYLQGEPSRFNVETGEKTVDLNMIDKSTRYWIASGLSDMRVAYESMVKKYSLYQFNSDFMEHIWGRLIYLRNLSVRRKPARWRVFENTHRIFCRFLDEGYFNELLCIKRKVNPDI